MMKIWKDSLQKINQDCFGRWTLRIFLSLLVLSFILPLIANEKPLLVYKDHAVSFPFLSSASLSFEKDAESLVLLAPIPYGPYTVDYRLWDAGPQGLSSSHILGTDEQGRDMLVRLLYALRFSILFGVFVTFISALIGTFIGLLQGYYGGMIDLVGQRVFELWSSIPALFFLMILSVFFVLNEWALIVGMIFIKSRTLIPMMRMLTIRVRSLPYIDAARVMGQRPFKICFMHILPNIIVFPLAKFPFMTAKAVSIITTLSFFGFSVPRNWVTFGEILIQGKNYLYAPWIVLGAIGFLVGLLLLLLLLGEALQRVFVQTTRNESV